MEKEKKLVWYDIIILICVYLVTASIPYTRFINDTELCYWLGIATRLIFFPIAFYLIRHDHLDSAHFAKPGKEDLKWIPFLFIGLSNFVVCWIMGASVNSVISGYDIFKDALKFILVALGEELVFRTLLFNEFDKTQAPWKSILFGSLIFGLIHIVNIGSLSSIVPVLIQCGYSFALGLLLCLIYHNKKNILYVTLVHFLFNFLNDGLVLRIYNIPDGWQYFVINIVYAAIFVLYAVAIVLFQYYKNKRFKA